MIRDATTSDAPACAALYAPYVTDTAISFETEPPDDAEMARRITAAHAWFVLEDDGHVAGYAYATPFATRAAYRWSCETSIYLERGRRRTGAGRALYETLFERLREHGFHRAFAGMTLPNEASAGLHRALGFEPAGVYRRVGWKHGAWHDVAWVQRDLNATEGCTSPPSRLT
ncbi:GNAT family N-acetyltransferase [Amycolatopsis sp. SID8362]|uniref:GNAT family N-acetyltransferase n=1 Tax=Amycolatopsis sp. SID8362 TaxID=2690346 RepID=UPI00136FE919|nr:GNAT family N-acetyltransferase [Amycolatopsis sp. SID8362]NBH05817.1 GNAT family N-acetyltransferase [Amycolatopsis sp. SID8362]NED42515.1 N-acetyltransferase [Amycolatopsis sp. SID8362]